MTLKVTNGITSDINTATHVKPVKFPPIEIFCGNQKLSFTYEKALKGEQYQTLYKFIFYEHENVL